MPVWHERTRTAREAGELALVGITEEQHPDRCALFAQWQRLDWPVLWDPFNLTEAPAVPIAIGIDEHGIVRSVGLTLDRLDDFLAESHDAGPAPEPVLPGVRRSNQGPRELAADATLDPDAAISRLLWSSESPGTLGGRDFDLCIAALERARSAADATPAAAFRLGVALRLRYDSAQAEARDFQASLDHWRDALRADPTQYIWRRRIQQWGPRLDKPYPFYGWIDQATREVEARGETPVALQVPLTTSEISGDAPVASDAGPREHPDPERRVQRDRDAWVTVSAAVAPHTGGPGEGSKPTSFQVHLVLRPSLERAVHWGNDAGPTEIWVEGAQALGMPRPDLVLAVPEAAESSAETRRADFTVLAPGNVRSVAGTAFYFVCEGREGECRFLAQDFEVPLPDRR